MTFYWIYAYGEHISSVHFSLQRQKSWESISCNFLKVCADCVDMKLQSYLNKVSKSGQHFVFRKDIRVSTKVIRIYKLLEAFDQICYRVSKFFGCFISYIVLVPRSCKNTLSSQQPCFNSDRKSDVGVKSQVWNFPAYSQLSYFPNAFPRRSRLGAWKHGRPRREEEEEKTRLSRIPGLQFEFESGGGVVRNETHEKKNEQRSNLCGCI